MNEFQYPKSITEASEPRQSEADAVRSIVQHLDNIGEPLITGNFRQHLTMSHGRIQQVLYWLGYRALEGTIKPYGRGHTWVWHKPQFDSLLLNDNSSKVIVYQDNEGRRRVLDEVFGMATGRATGETIGGKPWHAVDLGLSMVPWYDLVNAYEAAGFEVRIQIREKQQ